MVLILVREPGVALKLKKCCFFKNEIGYLGLVIKPGLLKAAKHIADAIHKLSAPTAVTGPRSYLGLCINFPHFVPKLTKLASLPSKRLKYTTKELCPLNNYEVNALETIKEIWSQHQCKYCPNKKEIIHWMHLHAIDKLIVACSEVRIRRRSPEPILVTHVMWTLEQSRLYSSREPFRCLGCYSSMKLPWKSRIHYQIGSLYIEIDYQPCRCHRQARTMDDDSCTLKLTSFIEPVSNIRLLMHYRDYQQSWPKMKTSMTISMCCKSNRALMKRKHWPPVVVKTVTVH